MDMVEKVARAIWEDRHPDIGWSDIERLTFLGHARSAIEAMREPTQAMLAAPTMNNFAWRTEEEVTHGDIALAWRQMIDAALLGE
jgi:hypothetical protein